MTDTTQKKGSGKTGYWRNRGAFDAYVNGHMIGHYATPEQADAAIAKAKQDTGGNET